MISAQSDPESASNPPQQGIPASSPHGGGEISRYVACDNLEAENPQSVNAFQFFLGGHGIQGLRDDNGLGRPAFVHLHGARPAVPAEEEQQRPGKDPPVGKSCTSLATLCVACIITTVVTPTTPLQPPAIGSPSTQGGPGRFVISQPRLPISLGHPAQ